MTTVTSNYDLCVIDMQLDIHLYALLCKSRSHVENNYT